MKDKFFNFWQKLTYKNSRETSKPKTSKEDIPGDVEIRSLDIPPHDPLLAYLISSQGAIEVDKLSMQSPTLDILRKNEIKLALPLVSQGELIGLLNLGPRLSEQEYSTDDKRLLNNLATQAAPAFRVAQLARQQQEEARERERLEHELKVARTIQQTLLPKDVPDPKSWHIAAHWQPAREVGGDFYDFINLPDNLMGILIADVTDKGVPAALVMATTRSILRAAAERLVSPGTVLERANELLCPDIPPNMFVTCLYIVFNPQTGELCFANAGHNLPFYCSKDQVQELRATGMPLGLMPGMNYEENSIFMSPGDKLLLYSDGLSEAHNSQREMFGTPRIRALLSSQNQSKPLIEYLFQALQDFTGKDWEQEDDVTFVTLERTAQKESGEDSIQKIGEFTIESWPGKEREAVEKVNSIIDRLKLPENKHKKLETAIAEATMNAMEHGNKYDPEIPVIIKIFASPSILSIQITDQGKQEHILEAEAPNLDAKLAGKQSPRGWGLFLIKNMVDDLRIQDESKSHTIELILNL